MGLILSGVQPTGDLHLGNYLGAIRHWVSMQDQHECLFCIVDLHALTVPQQPEVLRENILKTAAAYIASGIDPEKAAIYPQSRVSGHAELAWILNCHTPLGWLNRMTQFKDKAGKKKDQANLGLYAYPVLMAADILLYQATHVPVGEDQKQHLELARDIAGAFNRYYEQDMFIIPEPLIQKEGARIMSLRDGTKKMSKSDPSDYSRITFADDADTIALKIRKAKTDPLPLPESLTDLEDRPEAKNLLTLLALVRNISLEQAVKENAGQPFAGFKDKLAEALVGHLAPITVEYNRLMQEQNYLKEILNKGSSTANSIANDTLCAVKQLVGIA